jgi:hypothetical protein
LNRPDSAGDRDVAHSRVRQAFFAQTRWLVLLAIVALPLAGATFLLLTAPTVFSREMSWDLLFNLKGAWSLWNGQQLHVDIHDPLGIVTFGLTALGFHIAGIGPRAFLIGETPLCVRDVGSGNLRLSAPPAAGGGRAARRPAG